jgi:hypothetical protein
MSATTGEPVPGTYHEDASHGTKVVVPHIVP